ncbi:MAG: membrane protein insertion efficiency factor YidD [Pseudomonadales bacterium]
MPTLAIGVLRGYQLTISPLLGPRCRFYPSCSSYAIEAITTHGLLTGAGLACKRVMRCHPGNPGGIDEVPAVQKPVPGQTESPIDAQRNRNRQGNINAT